MSYLFPFIIRFREFGNNFPTDSMYDEDSNAESIRQKCEGNHEIKESDENWFECWTQDDSGDELGFDYLDEGP